MSGAAELDSARMSQFGLVSWKKAAGCLSLQWGCCRSRDKFSDSSSNLQVHSYGTVMLVDDV